ncbi:MAG: TRAM domain-containing protein, partial [Candidatus Eremiobacteraeota bacterium]|nr:TRAM domain-containing protein [Candidatus Eremiobacteraeota bacterium]
KDPSKMTGRSRNNRVVIIEGGKTEPGELVDTLIEESFQWGLKGRPEVG